MQNIATLIILLIASCSAPIRTDVNLVYCHDERLKNFICIPKDFYDEHIDDEESTHYEAKPKRDDDSECLYNN